MFLGVHGIPRAGQEFWFEGRPKGEALVKCASSKLSPPNPHPYRGEGFAGFGKLSLRVLRVLRDCQKRM